jgi:hypothetical protein
MLLIFISWSTIQMQANVTTAGSARNRPTNRLAYGFSRSS